MPKADVRRLALLRQLTDLGHAIGSIVALDIDQLRDVLATHATALASRLPDSNRTIGPPPLDRSATLNETASPSQRPSERRYDDATLGELAALSSTIACECPHHVADLLLRLSIFERYSAECERLGPDDAALHGYRQVAGTARELFESALERVAIHEGLMPRG